MEYVTPWELWKYLGMEINVFVTEDMGADVNLHIFRQTQKQVNISTWISHDVLALKGNRHYSRM